MSFYKSGTVTGYEFNEGFANLKIIGSPTITESGVASNFNSSNKLKMFDFPQYTSQTKITINIDFTTSQDVSGNQLITSGSADIVGQPALNFKNGIFGFGTWGTVQQYSSKGVVANTHYTASLQFTGSSWNIYVNNELILQYNYGLNTGAINNLCIGASEYSYSINDYFKGSIDLSKFTISIDNTVVYKVALNKASVSQYQTTARDFIEL